MTNPEEIMNIKDTVLRVVREKPYTRESYWQLFFEVHAELGIAKISGKHKCYIFPMANLEKYISPETISRAYRLLKAEDPSLRPIPEIEEERRQREAEMRDINIHWQPNHVSNYRKGIEQQTTLFGNLPEGDPLISCGTRYKEGL